MSKAEIRLKVATQHGTRAGSKSVTGTFSTVIDVPCPAEGCEGRVKYDGSHNLRNGPLVDIPCDACGRFYTFDEVPK